MRLRQYPFARAALSRRSTTPILPMIRFEIFGQSSPTVFCCSTQIWRMIAAIRHINIFIWTFTVFFLLYYWLDRLSWWHLVTVCYVCHILTAIRHMHKWRSGVRFLDVKTDPRIIIERMVIERNIIDVFIIEASVYRLGLLSNRRNTTFYRNVPAGRGCRGRQPPENTLFGGPFIAGVQGAAAPWRHKLRWPI